MDLIDSNGHYETTTSNVKSVLNVNLSTKKLLFKNSDIIFENDLIQIGIKVEPMKSVLRVEFYYGNKTNANLSNLSMAINLSPELESGKSLSILLIDFRSIVRFLRTSCSTRTNFGEYRSKSSSETTRNNRMFERIRRYSENVFYVLVNFTTISFSFRHFFPLRFLVV